MPTEFRSALPQDFDFCRRLYFAEMKWIIEKLGLDQAAQERIFQQQWDVTQVRIIALDGADIGWLQTVMQDRELFISQIFVDHPFQRRGVGTDVMKRLIHEAAGLNQTVRLHVVKFNPARRLYERLGFRIVSEDDLFFHMEFCPNKEEGLQQ